ncbi:MAG: ROK family transcriptional regulator [Eubacteriales bacterium]|nr:ROK family transcriptional regulator [Eubacteriales bacterium]
MKKATPLEVKKLNRKNIFKLIYQEKNISKQEISFKLSLSLPTVSHNLEELERLNLIKREEYFESTGGRKAKIITFISQAKITIGLELLMEQYHMVAIDLHGNILKMTSVPNHFDNSSVYYKTLCKNVNHFIDSLNCSQVILGIGIALQGLISSDGKSVTYGKILNCTGLQIDRFTACLHYPCRMIHDAEAATLNELWENPHITDAIFFHIRDNLSGSLIFNGKFLKGTDLKSGVFEHMTIIPNGKPCYCGKYGCMDTYCSTQGFLEADEKEAEFFNKLNNGNLNAKKRWQQYLEYLSIAIDNLHMVMDWDVILGGRIGTQFTNEDLDELHRLVACRTAFVTERQFIRRAVSSKIPIARGAALQYIAEFLEGISN